MTGPDRKPLADARAADPEGDANVLQPGALQDAIFNSASFSSIATDAMGVIQIFNVGAERMLGYSAAEVINRITPAAISVPEELVARAAALSLEFDTPIAPGFEALVFKASRGIEDIYELTKLRKDGSRFPAVVSVTALRDPQGTIIGYLLIGTDNTARKLAEEERIAEQARFEQTLRLKNVELEEASRMKSEFLANMSHELRTPLNAILGFSEVLRDGLVGEMTVQQRGFIGDIFGAGKHLLSLINDILDLSKVEAGKATLNLEPVQVSSLFANSMSIIREKAARRNIRLEMQAEEGLGAIQTDSRKVKQIVYNLLSNAVKFTSERGRVTLRAARVSRDDVVRFTSSSLGRSFPLANDDFDEFLEISVTDSGIGIAPEGLRQLFLPFSQVDGGLARKFEGTGLGLAMVKQLAELHGGTVAVQSVVGEGSCFIVWLPMRTMECAQPTPSSVSSVVVSPAVTAPGTALVVEDDYKSADLIRLQLEAHGFAVLHAASAEAALVLALQQPLSLITLDVMLPNMNGWELLGRIKQVQTLRHTPIVLISGVVDSEKALRLGAAAVVQKPIARQELSDVLIRLGLIARAQPQALKILVVDDDPRAVELVALRIRGLASTVLRAFGGREAIETARRERPDLIVLDLMMPDVSGFDVAEALKDSPETASIPILVLTAKRVTNDDRRKLRDFVTTIVEKSDFDRERFSAEVRRAMSGRHSGYMRWQES
jgi:signal transduction histidine kinase/CheY-like chemotaxis protein